MTDNEVIRFLNAFEGDEAAVVRTFIVWVNGREVTIKLHDRGEGAGTLRYYAHAFWTGLDLTNADPNANGHTIGNPDAEAETALHNLHWNVFES